ncbi:ParB/RepB/Spo0J family partition protein (plasmid) [Streptomyces zaomyceticus]|uniref:ParB/RepB/Spo0J family partition protein n=1 Tax=Streptomyces zaomyceticus TaxID=68286 RepID=A0ABZ1LMU5_9ACTN
MSKADMLGGSATFDAVTQPMSSRAAAFARFSGQETVSDDNRAATPAGGLRLPVAKLAHNPENPREELHDIEDLADSLVARGLIQPVAVVTRAAFLSAHPNHEQSISDAEYVVVDGNRRLAAAKMAGLDEVPAHLDDSFATDAEVLLENALVAAIHNHDLEPIEQAKVLQTLVEKYGSQRQVAKALNKSSGWVTQRMALLKLTPELQQAVEDKTLPVEVARQVGQLPQQQQHGAAQEALAARAEVKKRRKSQPAPPSAYGVSAPETSDGVTPDPARAEPPARTAPAGAYAVSTPQPAAVKESKESDAAAGIAASSGTELGLWSDGKTAMEQALAHMDVEQRTRFLHRYVELAGSTDVLVADFARGLPVSGRLKLATILEETSQRLRQQQ